MEAAMAEDSNTLIWIVLAAIPVGLLMISLWSRARSPGKARVDTFEQTRMPEER
jgi:hypothetical protein